MKVKDLNEKKPYGPSIMFYGPLGTGKTGFLSQAGSHAYVYDFDDGLRTAKTLQDAFTSQRQELEFDCFYEPNLRGATGLQSTFLKAKAHLIGTLNALVKKEVEPLLIYGLDSITGLVNAVKAMIKTNSGHPERNPSQEEWGLIINELETFMNLFKSLPSIKIVNAHDMAIEDADKVVKWRLLCPGRKLPMSVLGLFDDVFYCRILKQAGGRIAYTLSADPSPAAEARTRSSFKGTFDMNVGLFTLLEKLGYLTKEQKETLFRKS